MHNAMKHFMNKLIAMLTVLMLYTVAQAQPQKRKISEADNYKLAASHAMNKTEGEWKSLGTGKFREDFLPALFLVSPVEFEVEVQENTGTPGLYRVVSPYKYYPENPAVFEGDTYLEIDASVPDKVYLKTYDTRLDWGYGSMIINSIAYDRLQNEGTIDNAFKDGECGRLEEGIITFPTDVLLVYIEDLTMGMWKITNGSGMFRLVLPGAPDVDINMSINGPEEKDGQKYILVDYTLGKDCHTVKTAMIEGEYTAGLADKIDAGIIESVEITENGKMLFPYNKDGIYTFVAVPYFNGKRYRTTYKTVELSYLHEGWKIIGKAIYNEGFFSDLEPTLSLGMEEDDVMEVEVQESTERPGLFRLVDPYGPEGGYVYSNNSNYDTDHRYYLEIDATNPDRVFLKKTENGCGLDIGFGKMYLWCNAERYIVEKGYTEEEVVGMGFYGKREGRVITFPQKALCVKIPMGRDTWYWANYTGKFRVELPTGTSVECIVDNSETNLPVEYFNLRGMKVGRSNLKQGIYIKKQGSRSEKIIIE